MFSYEWILRPPRNVTTGQQCLTHRRQRHNTPKRRKSRLSQFLSSGMQTSIGKLVFHHARPLTAVLASASAIRCHRCPAHYPSLPAVLLCNKFIQHRDSFPPLRASQFEEREKESGQEGLCEEMMNADLGTGEWRKRTLRLLYFDSSTRSDWPKQIAPFAKVISYVDYYDQKPPR